MAGSTRRSLQELSAEVATNPNSTAFVELAAAYRELGDLERALRLCLRGLQRHPTHVEAHYELGRLYEARGERELALDEWNVVRQLAPDHVATRLALAGLYVQEGRAREAEAELRALDQLAPGDAQAAELRKQLRAAPRVKAREASEGGNGGARVASPPTGEVFESLRAEYPGALGVLLADEHGTVIEGRVPGGNGDPVARVGVNLAGARAEAERIAAYLRMGELRGMAVESGGRRLVISLVGRNVVIVAMSTELPAGQAARLVQRACEIAEAYLKRKAR
jgi:tetratricopeptide (TPR) repeat protein